MTRGVNKTDKEKGKLHEVFEPSFDCKECFDGKMIVQKLNYMHNNPSAGKWQLVVNPVDYKHSSAMFYSMYKKAYYPVTNYME